MCLSFKERYWHECWECDDPKATVHITYLDGMEIEWEVQVIRHETPSVVTTGLAESF